MSIGLNLLLFYAEVEQLPIMTPPEVDDDRYPPSETQKKPTAVVVGRTRGETMVPAGRLRVIQEVTREPSVVSVAGVTTGRVADVAKSVARA